MSESIRIGRRILLLVVASVSLLLALLVSSLILAFHMNAQVTTLTGNVIPSLETINGVAVKFASIRATILRYMLAPDEADRMEQARKLMFFRQGLDRDLAHYESDFVVDPREKALLQQVRDAVQAFDARQYEILAVSAQAQDVRAALAETQLPLGQVSEALRRHHDYSFQLAADAVDASRHSARLGSAAMVLLSLLAAVPLLVFAYRIRDAVAEMAEGFQGRLVDLREHGTQVAAAAADLLLVSRKLSELADGQSIQAEQMRATADDLEIGIPGVHDRLAEAREQVARTARTLSRMKDALDSLVLNAGQARPGPSDELLRQTVALFGDLEADVGRSGAVMLATGVTVEAQCRNTMLLIQQSGKVARLVVENTAIAANASASALGLFSIARVMNDELGRRAA
ncbi:MCP four helix bundle domain-containing protein [Zoogloea dura]|jgi:hypothetical protein|uniref:Chemotaxis methyl-accepting receptor HlyB-like 4HB MCP domain-containing protein n=1 Tax=Zoogloea dura TaxID=2728840 RepID=A0A848FZ60_9RHOO|nr:MCP four helix bundle domain-containing protein [Zoogloea dura]NML25198.1 hypothetical protein [Zoogloea dura]